MWYVLVIVRGETSLIGYMPYLRLFKTGSPDFHRSTYAEVDMAYYPDYPEREETKALVVPLSEE